MRLRSGIRTGLMAVLLLLSSAAPGAAQFGASVGANNYGGDAFCLNTGAFFSFAEVSYGGDAFGASVSAMNSDIPWMPIPGSGGANIVVPGFNSFANARQQEAQYLSQGEAIQATIEAYPLSLLRRRSASQEGLLVRLDRNLRPYVGAGVLFLTDGDPAPAGEGRNLPTFGLRSLFAPVITYGARLYLPSRESGLGLVLQYRGNSAFVRDAEYEEPDGSLIAAGDKTLTWGTWSVGVSFRVGG